MAVNSLKMKRRKQKEKTERDPEMEDKTSVISTSTDRKIAYQ